MERPKTTSMLLAGKWITHMTNERAWDDMREMVGTEPARAWRIIQALVGAAPDYDVLAAVAAGPVEDLLDQHGDSFMARIAEEAAKNARLRICLRAAYSNFPPELTAIIEAESADVRDLAVPETVTVSGDDLALILGWLHHSDTAWSAELLREMSTSDPSAAWDVLRVLAMFAEEDLRLRDGVFDDAFEPFMHQHFSAFRDKLVELARNSAAFRHWSRERRRAPIDDSAVWAAFITDIASG